MRSGGSLPALVATAMLVLAAPANAAPAATVNAEGNPFTGGLAFDPAEVSVQVGEVVQWTNTDPFVPHTATEEHELWDLSGDYGATPLNPSGFGPGESVERDFDAGTFSYYCRVHGRVQSGVVEVPVTLRTGSRLGVRWGSGPLPDGQVFDVQRRAGRPGHKGRWRTVLEGTSDARETFGYGRRADLTSLGFRARVRSAADPQAVSGWSPPVAVDNVVPY